MRIPPIAALRIHILICVLIAALSGCSSEPHEDDEPGQCSDGIDNDLDGFVDCPDNDCAFDPACLPGDDDTSGDDDDDSAAGDDDDDDDDSAEPPAACEPALQLGSAETVPLGLVILDASGGTGEYEFSFQDNLSGGALNPLSGSYLAGITSGVTDIIVLSDVGCVGQSSAEISVVPDMSVSPAQIAVVPGQAFTFLIEHGSGNYTCELFLNDGGGTLDTTTCSYQAGTAEGNDGVRFLDLSTGQERLSWITVDAGASPAADPGHVFIALGSSQEVSVRGGSGHWDLVADTSGVIDTTSALLQSLATGSTTLDITDQFTSLSTSMTVSVVAPQEASLPTTGEQLQEGHALSMDANGDGYLDAVMSSPGANVSAYRGGIVLLWLGGEDGLETQPARTWSGERWDDQLGRGLASGDFDADGMDELAIGTPYLEGVAGTNNGTVEVYGGVAGGTMTTEPVFQSEGDHSYDYYGFSVAACDINGDGFDDLVVGSSYDEDRSGLVTYANQGALHLYLGSAQGLSTSSYQVVYGQAPTTAGWQPTTNLKIGLALSAGDVDDDGYCDVVTSNYTWSGNNGAVFVYLGSATGLGAAPMAAWTGTSPTAGGADHFGRSLAVGDVDGDGKDDILVGEWAFDGSSPSYSNNGAAWLFLGQDFSTSPPITGFAGTDSADWTYQGNSSWDYAGIDLKISDMDGVAPLDLVITAVSDEISGGPNNSGVVSIFHGVQGGLPAATADESVAGLANGDWFGMFVASLGDLQGDGSTDLFVHAHRDNTHGLRVGAPYFVPGPVLLGDDDDSAAAEDPGPTALDFPASAMGQHHGWNAAFVGDITGDGFNDLVVGARGADSAASPLNSGTATLYLGSATGIESQPAMTFMDFTGNSASDEFGTGISSAGDFNGDGIPDFAVTARYDDRPSSFNSNYANPSECPGNRSGSGAVFVFLGCEPRPDGLACLPASEPAFVFYGSRTQNRIEFVDGGLGFDYNGDLYDDLVLGFPQYDGVGTDSGGVVVVAGQSANPIGISVICSPEYEYFGVGNGDDLGKSVATLGDLDGDGCSEFAAGVPDSDSGGFNNQGGVAIFWGKGAGCASQAAEWSLLAPFDSNARAGWALDSGGDVDNDGYDDLAVGGYTLSADGDAVGAAWVVPAAYLSTLPSEPVVVGQAPSPLSFSPLVDSTGQYWVHGTVHNEQFGRSVALVPGISVDGRAGLLVGSPQSGSSGVDLSGGAFLYEFLIDQASYGLDQNARASFGGETTAPDSRLGEQISGGLVGGVPYAVVGGYRADGLSMDSGAAYVLKLAP